MGNLKGISASHHTQDFDIFCKSYDFFFFSLLYEGMSTAIVAKFAQNNPKPPTFVKIYPKTISWRNFEIPPKLKFSFFSKKENPTCRRRTKACSHFLDFQYNNFLYAFLIVKKWPLYVNLTYPLVEKNFFSMFHTSYGYEIL